MIAGFAIDIHLILLAASLLLVISILGAKAAERLGVPSLLIFLGIGMLAGSEGLGGIEFDNPYVAQFLGTVALAYILFAGGLDTDWRAIRPVLARGIALATLGVLATALLVALFAVRVLGFSWIEGVLLGSVMASTDAAAVFAVLRSKWVGLKGSLKPLLEFESGSNDPMAVFLTVTVLSLMQRPEASWLRAVPDFLLQMSVGAAMGLALGRGVVYLINRAKLEYEGLYPVLTVALVLLVYSATQALHGNGFLAVYVAGLVFGNSRFEYKTSLKRFHDGVAWLMQIAMFLTLGLLVFPSRVWAVTPLGLGLAAFLMFVARPAAVFLCTGPAAMSARERILVSWVGLRGAVPIVLATFPLLAGAPKAEMIFNLVFFVVLTSVLLQGKSIPIVAGWLGLAKPYSEKQRAPLELERAPGMSVDMLNVAVRPDSPARGRRIDELGLPHGVAVALVTRGSTSFVPDGDTVLEAGDALMILADETLIPAIMEAMGEGGPKE